MDELNFNFNPEPDFDSFDHSNFGMSHQEHYADVHDGTNFGSFSLGGSDDYIGYNTPHIDQTTNFTCAVVSQEMILHGFGIPVSEAQLVFDATHNGWLDSHGTSLDDMGRLLEHYGIPTHLNPHGDLPSLIDELAQGHKVIVGVDSGELWGGQSFWQKLTGIDNYAPDHAVVVSGLDFSDPSHPKIIIDDPGSGAGHAESYPLEHFIEAWNDSNFTYCATDLAPPNLEQLDVGFNEETGIYGALQDWQEWGLHVAENVEKAVIGIAAVVDCIKKRKAENV
jgi:hypothetical protein